MDLRRCQIWARTGKHIIQADYVKTKCARTESGPSDADQSVELDELFGTNDDPLIPKSADIDRIFHQGRETWKQFVKSAEALPPNSFPPGLMEPSIMLKDVPALPEKIPTKALIGQPVWHIPSPEQEQEEHLRNENNSLKSTSAASRKSTISRIQILSNAASPHYLVLPISEVLCIQTVALQPLQEVSLS